MSRKITSVHQFTDLESTQFSPKEYSYLKFGSDSVARKYAKELAWRVFIEHRTHLIANKAIVIPSPYNYVLNAATILTRYFVDELNHLIVNENGEHVDYSTIHRKVSYIKDYGYLTMEQRKQLIDQDEFYLNPEFYGDRTLIFVDDVRITGTHEIKLRELLDNSGIANPCIFAYYAQYIGKRANIESEINFAGIKNVSDYVKLLQEPGTHITVRPIKYILSRTPEEMFDIQQVLSKKQVADIYYGCLGEGYYKIPEYQSHFERIKYQFTKSNES